MERPEWVTCIQHTHAEKHGKAWCGSNTTGVFAFQDIDHAAYSQIAQDRLTVCPECLEAVTKALKTQT